MLFSFSNNILIQQHLKRVELIISNNTIIIINNCMKIFDKKHLQKFDEFASKLTGKPMASTSTTPISVPFKPILLGCVATLSLYHLYREVQQWRLRKEQINFEKISKGIANKVILADSFNKLMNLKTLDKTDNIAFANKRYFQLLQNNLRDNQEAFRSKEIIISSHQTCKYNLGFLKLHTFCTQIILTPNNQFVKRTLKSKLKLFNVGYFSKQHEANNQKKDRKKRKNHVKDQKIEIKMKDIEKKMKLGIGKMCSKINWLNYALGADYKKKETKNENSEQIDVKYPQIDDKVAQQNKISSNQQAQLTLKQSSSKIQNSSIFKECRKSSKQFEHQVAQTLAKSHRPSPKQSVVILNL